MFEIFNVIENLTYVKHTGVFANTDSSLTKYARSLACWNKHVLRHPLFSLNHFSFYISAASWDVVLFRFTWTFVRMPTTSVRDAIPNWGHSGGYNRPQLPNAMPYI